MSSSQPIVIKEHIITGPYKKKDGKGEYMLHTITTEDNEEFKLFGKLGSNNPIVGKQEVTDISTGASFNLITEQSGKFKKILVMNLVEKSPWETITKGVTTSHSSTDNATSNLKVAAVNTKLNSQVSTSKDLSMELSGLLQSLITTGHYHSVREHETPGYSPRIFINEKLLEQHMKIILETKDRLAQQRQG